MKLEVTEAWNNLNVARLATTTATTISGLLPLTLVGGEMWGAMGWTIIGGLLVSTILTLIVVPVLYMLSERGKKPVEIP